MVDEFQFFPTPAGLAARMIAKFSTHPWGRDARVLEPSAGDGALVRALVDAAKAERNAWMVKHHTYFRMDDLVLGNRVDLKSCPFLNNHPIAESEYAVVTYIERAVPGCVVIGYEGIDHVGYQLGTSVQVRAPKDVPDPIVKVHPLGKPEEWEEWHISQNLTDRWGDLNHYDADNKPLDLLADDDGLLERLVNQMWGESTFVVRKDGKFGILFEVEFCSLESEEPEKENSPDWYATLKPHTEVVKALLEGMHPLAEKFPNVQFAVPDEEVIINDRPAAWAFVPDGLLNKEQRKELGNALLGL